MKDLNNQKGSATVDVIIAALIIIFVLLPIGSVVMERYILLAKGQQIKDAVDLSNIAAYNALDAQEISKTKIVEKDTKVYEIYKSILARNLNLNEDLTPKVESIAEAQVKIESLTMYTDKLPLVCPNGTNIKRPAVHAYITVPVRPSLFRSMLMQISGRGFIEMKVHVDSDLPVNN